MEVLISKVTPLLGTLFIEIFHPRDGTPFTYLFNVDGNLFSYRKSGSLFYIAGEDMGSFNADMIGVIKRLITKATKPTKSK